jgi:hypothetical protein
VLRCCAGPHSRERRIRERWVATMLDNREKTTKLLAALKAAVPFEVELTEQVVKQLRMDEKHHTVSELSYAGGDRKKGIPHEETAGRVRHRRNTKRFTRNSSRQGSTCLAAYVKIIPRKKLSIVRPCGFGAKPRAVDRCG